MADGTATPIEIDPDALTAAHLTGLARLREIALESAEALAERQQVARKCGDDEVVMKMAASLTATERSYRQTVLLEDHLKHRLRERRAERSDKAEVRRKAAETRTAELSWKIVDVLDRPEHGREKVERLYLEYDRWLAAHQDDPDFLTAAVPAQIEAIAAALGVEVSWTSHRERSYDPPTLIPSPPQRDDPPFSPRSARRVALGASKPP